MSIIYCFLNADLGRLAQSGASLTADQGVAGSSSVQPHTFVELYHKIISVVIPHFR